jgi:hypothetical protein
MEKRSEMRNVTSAPMKKRENANAHGSYLNAGCPPTKLSMPVTAAAIKDEEIART